MPAEKDSVLPPLLNIHPTTKHVAQICLCRTLITSPFPTSSHLSPGLRPPSFFIPQISKASGLQGGGSKTCSPIASLGCFVNKPFRCCKPQCLRVWFAVHQMHKLCLVKEQQCSCRDFDQNTFNLWVDWREVALNFPFGLGCATDVDLHWGSLKFCIWRCIVASWIRISPYYIF